MIDRAAAAGYEALVLTVDTAVFGRRERDVRRGFTLPPTIGPGTLLDGALHPAWTWAFVRSEPIRFANVVGRDVGDGASPVTLSDYINAQFDPGLSWTDVDWLRSVWDGPIVLKGVQTVADARLAADAGVEAIALSNHGGRQLDGAPATFPLVAPVADAVGGRTEIICDGGVRRGSDIVKAVAAGATAAMAGRAYLYGLGAAGERGVDRVLDWFHADVLRTMALLGAGTVDELDRRAAHAPDARLSAARTDHPDASSSSPARSASTPPSSATIRTHRARSLSVFGATSTMRFDTTRPASTIAVVEMRLTASFCAVPAFRRVEPVSTSGPVSSRTARAPTSSSGVPGLFAIPQVRQPRRRACRTPSTTNGVVPLAASPTTVSSGPKPAASTRPRRPRGRPRPG